MEHMDSSNLIKLYGNKMSKVEFLKNLELILNNNVGSKLTPELASGLYGTINQMIEQIKIEEKAENGKSENSK